MTIDYSKIRHVKSPSRGGGDPLSRSAGLDFFIPALSGKFINDFIEKNQYSSVTRDGFKIEPQGSILIPSGIKMNIQPNIDQDSFLYPFSMGLAMIAFNKSGVSTKLGLDVMACVVDEDYQGEIHISLTNTTNEPVEINFGDKIIQFLFIPVLLPEVNEKDEAELFNKETSRGMKGFGSTGNN